MAKVLPFTAVHYNQNLFSGMSDLLSPPSQDINPDVYKFLKKNENNFSSLIYSDDQGSAKYKTLTNNYLSWLLRDILFVDKKPSYYILEEEIIIDNKKYKRYSLTGLIQFDEDSQSIKPLEKPRADEVESRYSLLKEAKNNLESLVCFYKDEKFTLINKFLPLLDDKKLILNLPNQTVNYKFYQIEDENLIKEISSYFVDKRIYVADSDNYYSAFKLMNEMKSQPGKKLSGKEPYNFVMANLYNIYDQSVVFQPVNRFIRKDKADYINILKQLESVFKIGAIAFTDSKMEMMAKKKMRMILDEYSVNNTLAFGIFLKSVPNRFFILTQKENTVSIGFDASKDMETDILESGILSQYFNLQNDQFEKSVFYEKDDNKTIDAVKSGLQDIAIILPSIRKKKLIDMLDSGSALPSQSICLSPSLLRGVSSFSFKYSTIMTI